MPRDRQAPQAQNSQSYGQKNELIQAQKQIPLPQETSPGPTGPAPGAGPTGPVDLMQAAREFQPNITPLTAPTERPGEPVTTGLNLGAGAGPEIFSQPARASQAADVLTALAEASGNDSFLELAAQIRRTGGM